MNPRLGAAQRCLLAVVVVAVVPVSVASATAPGQNGLIAFAHHAGNVSSGSPEVLDVFGEPGTAGTTTPLVSGTCCSDGSAPVDSTGWSADGTRLAYEGQNEGWTAWPAPYSGTYVYGDRIWVIPVDSSTGTPTRTGSPVDVSGVPYDYAPAGSYEWGGGDSSPSWSPDGRHIAVYHVEDQYSGFYQTLDVLNADGSGRSTVLGPPAGNPQSGAAPNGGQVSWSPDGTKIAIYGYTDYTQAGGIVIVPVDPSTGQKTGSPVLLAGTSGYGNPDWSPDGSDLVVSETGLCKLAIIDGHDGHRVSEISPASGDCYRSARFSPDGAKLLVERTPSGGYAPTELYSVDSGLGAGQTAGADALDLSNQSTSTMDDLGGSWQPLPSSSSSGGSSSGSGGTATSGSSTTTTTSTTSSGPRFYTAAVADFDPQLWGDITGYTGYSSLASIPPYPQLLSGPSIPQGRLTTGQEIFRGSALTITPSCVNAGQALPGCQLSIEGPIGLPSDRASAFQSGEQRMPTAQNGTYNVTIRVSSGDQVLQEQLSSYVIGDPPSSTQTAAAAKALAAAQITDLSQFPTGVTYHLIEDPASHQPLVYAGTDGTLVPAVPGGQIIAAGSGNVINAGAHNVINAGAGNAQPTTNFFVVDATGQTVAIIAAGSGNFGAQTWNVIPAGPGTGYLDGFGNVVAWNQVTPAIIAAGSGNIIAAGSGNVVAAGAGNIIAAGSGNLLGEAGGNLIGEAGGNIIAAGSGNIIAAGAYNFTALVAGAVQSAFTGSGSGFAITTPPSLAGADVDTIVAAGSGNVINAGAFNLTRAVVARARHAAPIVVASAKTVMPRRRGARVVIVERFTAKGTAMLTSMAKANRLRRTRHQPLLKLRLTLGEKVTPLVGGPVIVKRTFTITPGRAARKHKK